MKKTGLIICLFLALKSLSQNEYYDALKLRDAIRWIYVWNITSPDIGVPPTFREESIIPYPLGFVKNDTIINGKRIHFVDHGIYKIAFSADVNPMELMKTILRRYSSNPDDNDFSKIRAEYLTNDFINPFIVNNERFTFGGTFANLFTSSPLSAIDGLNVTNFADGLAKFMVKRFKEELNLAFFQKFKEEISKDKYVELRILFPETYKLLRTIDKEIYRYNVYIVTLREAFIKDLTNIFADLRKLLNTDKYKNFLEGKPVFRTILTTSLYIIDGLSRGVHAGDILANFPVDELKFKPDSLINEDSLGQNMKGAINTLKLFSASLRSQSSNRYWISTDSLALLFNDKDNITFRIYMGLLYQKAKNDNIRFKDKKNLTIILDTLASHLGDLVEYRKFIESFIDKAEEVNDYLEELKGKKKSEIDYNDYYKLFNASLDVIEHAFSFTELPYTDLIISAEEKKKISEKSGHLLFAARTAGEIYVDARTKNYSSAILNTIILLDTLVKDSSATVKSLILKYGTFMATVAAANNSDDVANAIEAVALPVGGSGIKKHSDFNISIQTYLGGSYGTEKIKELKNNQKKNLASVFAPVGISFNWGVFKKWKNPASIGVHINLLDIGTLASFRFKDSTTAINSEILLKNILAPGAYVIIGIPQWPLSIGYGLQAGPQLRDIKDGTPTIETKKIYTRSSFFIAVDIPLFNLYNRSK